MSEIGIDISEYQSNVNYLDVIKQIKFVILRIGYGVSYLPNKQKDKQFDNHYSGFYGKVPIGAYYYSYAKNIGDGKKEAENCLKYLNGKKLDLPIFYDLEDKTMNNVEIVAREFVNTIKASGYKAGIYTYEYWTKSKLDLSKFSDCEIWIASYGTNNGQIQEKYKPSYKDINIWQYTSRGHVNGINGYVDMNISYNTIVKPIEAKAPQIIYSGGDDTIKNIQSWLNTKYRTGLKIDGYYGKETKKAIIKGLQSELNVQFGRKLVIDGIFGNKTKNSCPIVKYGDNGNITKLLQSILYCKGYNPNGVDGVFGKGTENAIRKFQANMGLNVDGIVGKNTFEKLFN